MKKLLLILLLAPVLAFSQSRREKKEQEKNNKITLTNIEAHVQYLASDKLEGRRTGTPGEALAMQYIATQFQKDGLQPKGTNGYIQEFRIDEGKKYTPAGNSLTVGGHQLELGKDFFPLAFSSNGTASGEVSMALQEQDLPWFVDLKYMLDDNRNNPHYDIMKAVKDHVRHAKEEGATAVIVYNSGQDKDVVQYDRFDTVSIGIPVVYLTRDGESRYFSDPTDTYDLQLKTGLTHNVRFGHNVVGFLNFNAPTTVIVGAHYDHLGYGEDGNSLDGEGQVHNGADDNASGVAALIELGRILQKTKAHDNNYLFIAFSGEELGLLGSKYWLDHESVNITPNYMINLDMVGRYDTARKLVIGGYGTSPVWGSVLGMVQDRGVVTKFDSSGLGPSDHASFYMKDIPVLYFFTNTHQDYHKASDDADKINYPGEVAVINYIDKVIEAADARGKLAFSKTRDTQMTASALPVTLGVMPDYAFTGTGLRIDAVSKGKTAEKIGLQSGDILIQLGNYKFVDIQTYMQALQHFKRGDATTLRIKRGEKEMEFAVQF